MPVEREELRLLAVGGLFVQIPDVAGQRGVVLFFFFFFRTTAELQVPLVLDDIRLAIDRRQATRGLDQDHAEHAVRHVLPGHALGGAVVEERALPAGLELQRLRLTRLDLGDLVTAAGPHHRVKVDAVGLEAVGRVGHRQVHRVAFDHADQRTGDRVVEGPDRGLTTAAQIGDDLARGQGHVHRGGGGARR